MATLTTDDKLDPRLSAVVNDDTDSIVALVERESIEYEFNEESAEYERAEDSRVLTNPTTEQPAVSFTAARADDGAALDELGVRDPVNEGQYVRGDGRGWDALEIWTFESDADIEVDEADVTDRFEDVEWDIESVSHEDNGITFDATCRIHGDIYLGYEPGE